MVSKKINEVVKRKRNFTDRSVNRIRWLTCGRSWWSFSFSLVFNQFEFQLVWLCVCISLLSNKLTTNDLSLYHLVWESHWVTFLAHHRRPLECDSSAEDRSLISSKIYCIDTMRPRLNRWRFKSADKSNGCAVLCKGKLWQVIELFEKIKKKSLFIFLSRSICLTSHSCQTIRSRTRRRLKRRKKKVQRQSERICRIAFEICNCSEDFYFVECKPIIFFAVPPQLTFLIAQASVERVLTSSHALVELTPRKIAIWLSFTEWENEWRDRNKFEKLQFWCKHKSKAFHGILLPIAEVYSWSLFCVSRWVHIYVMFVWLSRDCNLLMWHKVSHSCTWWIIGIILWKLSNVCVRAESINFNFRENATWLTRSREQISDDSRKLSNWNFVFKHEFRQYRNCSW